MSVARLVQVVALAIAVNSCVAHASGPTAPAASAEIEARVKDDLAAFLKVPVTTIAVVEATAVTWPDAGLGCVGQRGVREPAPVPGYRIVLSHAGRTFRYHADRGTRFVRCPEIAKPVDRIQ